MHSISKGSCKVASQPWPDPEVGVFEGYLPPRYGPQARPHFGRTGQQRSSLDRSEVEEAVTDSFAGWYGEEDTIADRGQPAIVAVRNAVVKYHGG